MLLLEIIIATEFAHYLHIVKQRVVGGSLGSCVDEERSKMRDLT